VETDQNAKTVEETETEDKVTPTQVDRLTTKLMRGGI
jgi:hypothetical protein